MSPRAYQAKLDLLRVQDCLWARMRPSEIARKLEKDKAWVSRAIRKLHEEGATAFQTPTERECVEQNLAHLKSLLAFALSSVESANDNTEKLAAIRTASHLIRQKAEYELAIGRVQKSETRQTGNDAEDADKWRSLMDDLSPGAIDSIQNRLAESERRRPALHARMMKLQSRTSSRF